MADLGGQFNASDVDPLGDFSPIPAGEYRCVAIKSDWKHTKDGQGRYLEFTWQIVDGEHQSRMLFSRLNLENKSQQAVNIARSELSSICRATGCLTPRDTAELHDVPVMVKVALKKREDNGEMTNEVKGYSSVKDYAQKQQDAHQPAAASGGVSEKPSWM